MIPNPPNRAMVIVAHPDDPEFFCGGTVAMWCAAGTEVIYLILTNGNKGSDDPTLTPETLAKIRQKEQQAAADLLGVKEIIFFNEPDGELESTLELRKQVVTQIRKHQPDAVIALDPTRFYFENRYVNHADHRAAGEVAIDAIYPAARNRMYHPELLEEGLEPHTVKDIYIVEPEQPTMYVDITDVFETKVNAILCHASQITDPEGSAERWRKRATITDEYGRQVMREGFRVMNVG